MAGRKKPAAAKVPKAANGGRFQKGRSGNPGGRPKIAVEVRELARSYTTDALQTLVTVMGSEKAKPSERVSAAQAILDRGWGKPSQPVGGADDLPPLGGVTRVEFVVVDPGK